MSFDVCTYIITNHLQQGDIPNQSFLKCFAANKSVEILSVKSIWKGISDY